MRAPGSEHKQHLGHTALTAPPHGQLVGRHGQRKPTGAGWGGRELFWLWGAGEKCCLLLLKTSKKKPQAREGGRSAATTTSGASHRGWRPCRRRTWLPPCRWPSPGSARRRGGGEGPTRGRAGARGRGEGGGGGRDVDFVVAGTHAPLAQGPPKTGEERHHPRTLRRRWIRPTGNCRPALAERLVGFFLSPFLSPIVPLAPLPVRPFAPLPVMVAGLLGSGEGGEEGGRVCVCM